MFDRVKSGEMPPKKSAQPSMGDRAAFLEALGKGLRTALLERQAKEGRGPVRRLTRAEYDATVNDLLHTQFTLQPFFPDDAVTAGFDKLGEGLTLSAAHLAAYQEAAEKALNMAIEHVNPLRWEINGAKIFKSRETEFTNWGCWAEGDAIVIGSPLNYPYLTMLSASSQHSGRYRFTFTAQARNNGGKSLPVALGILNWRTVRPAAPGTSR